MEEKSYTPHKQRQRIYQISMDRQYELDDGLLGSYPHSQWK